MANSNNETVLQLELPGVKKLKSGKVREVFDLGDRLLFVASDRLSAFDVIMPNGIPRKGEVLTQISYFWFAQTESFQPNHLLSRAERPVAEKSSAICRPARAAQHDCEEGQPLAIECVVRGYLAGSGWKEYQKSQTVCGIKLPPGLKESSELPEPIFTPATKAETGHDENISFAEAAKIVGADIAEEARAKSLKIYNSARDYARKRGIIIADTKFEFGLFDGKLILIDEVLTPDSSRFWPADQYAAGQGPAELRQAICPRLPGNARLEQDPARPGAPAGGRRQDHGEISGGLRKADGKKTVTILWQTKIQLMKSRCRW